MGHKFGADPHHLIYNGRLYIYSTDDTQQYELNSKDANGLPTQSNGYPEVQLLAAGIPMSLRGDTPDQGDVRHGCAQAQDVTRQHP